MSHTPVKIPRPGPTRNKIPRPDPTRPENILKNVPRPRTGFGPVRSGPGKLGVSGCPAGLYYELILNQNQIIVKFLIRSRVLW